VADIAHAASTGDDRQAGMAAGRWWLASLTLL